MTSTADFMRIARNIGDLIVGINRNKKNIEDACIETEKKEASLYNSKISEAKKKCDREKVLLIGKGSHYLNAKTNIEAHLKHIDGEEAKIPDYLKSILVAGGRKLPYVAGFDELNVVHYVRIRDLIEKINGDTVYAKLKRALAKSPKGFRLLQAIADILGVPPDKIAALHDALQRDVAEAMSTLEAARVFVDGKKVLNEKYLKSEMKRIENECDAAIKRAEVTRNDNIKKARNKRDGELKRENDRLESPDNIRLFNNFNRDMSDFFKRYGVSGRDLSRFSPPTAYPGEFMIGAIEHCLVPSPDQERILRARMPFAYGNGKVLQIPLCIPVNSPGNILVEYDGSAKDTVMSGVQSMILKIFKFMPMFSYNIIYIDPNDRGTNLGIPLKLDRIPSAPSLLQVVASPGDIERVFGELEGFVDETTRAIAGIESVYKYNEGRKAVEAIPYHTIIINDFPHGFTNSSLEVLKVLLNNSEKCGISLVFVTRDAAKVPDAVKRNFLRITAQKGCAIVPFGGEKYAFKFDSTPRREEYEAFIKSVRNVYDKGIEIENRFGKLFNLSRPIPYRDAAEKIKIPFAVDSRGKIIDLELGGSNSAHAFITGDTGSGKSTALHWLISSIALHYRASDVELWLADYLNVEFALYVNNVLPHVKFIGLDKSADFSYSLLVKVQREFEERLEKFKASAVTDIGGYNSNMRNSGKPVMPRILILIDEFHLMSQACEREDKYKTMLSNQVREVRKAGISYILSDQAASKGLPGLSAEAKEMIRVRIAMRNSPDELRETLGIAHSYYTTELNYKIDTMKEGHMIIKRVVGEDAGARVIVDRYKAIFIDRKAGELAITSKHACRRAQDDGYNGERPFVVLKKERTVPDEKAIEEHDRGTGASRDGAIPIHVGTPMTFEPFFYFGLEKQYDNNLIVVGGDDDIRISVLLCAMGSFMRYGRVYVFAQENDSLYGKYQSYFDPRRMGVFTDMGEICSAVEEILKKMSPGTDSRILVVWLGMEILARGFSRLPEKVEPGDWGEISSSEDLCAKIDAIGANFLDAEDTSVSKGNRREREKIEETYDVRPDIEKLILDGPVNGIHTMVTFPATGLMKREDMRFLRVENFNKKIAFGKETDEYDNLGYPDTRNFVPDLDADSAVFNGGGPSVVFKPYRLR